MEKESWKRTHGCGGIIEEESWGRNHVGVIRKGIIEKESSESHLGAIWKELGAIWETSGGHLGGLGSQGAPKVV